MLKGDALSFRYSPKQPWIVQNLTIQVAPTEAVGLVAPSGFGKTTLAKLLDAAGKDGVGLLTVQLPDPTGYGRIVRDWHGNVLKIVEQKDAHGDELAITEVNTGILVAPTVRLTRWLAALKNDNAQGEYYLTDCIAQAVHDGVKVAGVVCADTDETLGVNSKAQLAQAERVVQRRIAERLMEAGATLADPARIDVRGELTVGADVFIDVGCVFEGRVQLSDGARIGPYSVLRNVSVGAHTEVVAFSFFEDSTIGAGARLGPFSRLRPGAPLRMSCRPPGRSSSGGGASSTQVSRRLV